MVGSDLPINTTYCEVGVRIDDFPMTPKSKGTQ